MVSIVDANINDITINASESLKLFKWNCFPESFLLFHPAFAKAS